MKDYNENLVPWQQINIVTEGGKGSIETYDNIEHMIWQTRSSSPTKYENNLGDALEIVLAETHELPEIVLKLNDLGIFSRDGSPFTEESFKQELSRLAEQ
ncbi:recombinase-like helix-turn-helix domain-containing protein [Paraglaciecola arctica]|uniref:Recombinase-like domain-containing protein n=1 Tax=Paraglaciecola arctica BSs20135 TaxID=493475 RepID=K6Z6J4_9ALTE|nr:recombinase-like helix-turn-helix domain-containing protein [Paraglaciecola arctica]GAC19070.1 conserved hypothetical protein [Paraglaciecola arctica BSs20135]|tara:strand:- start:1673 stop:1972 length:300 start_codon:yes stop_codon:yes gene_type:complete